MGIRPTQALIAGAFFASLSCIAGANAGAITFNTSPFGIDGWTISWPTGVNLGITQDATTATQVDVQKSVTFSAPGQGFQITFAPNSSSTGTTATTFVIPSESVTNSTGSSFTGFAFILLNSGSVDATFGGTSPGFTPPSGTGYDYTSVSLVNNDTELDYLGTQANGVTSIWGDGNPGATGDNLVIDAPAGSDFSLKELAISGPPSPPTTVPLPASIWQSLAGLAGLAVIAGVRSLKKRGLV